MQNFRPLRDTAGPIARGDIDTNMTPPPPAEISRVVFSRRIPCDLQTVTYLGHKHFDEADHHEAWKDCVLPVAEIVLRQRRRVDTSTHARVNATHNLWAACRDLSC